MIRTDCPSCRSPLKAPDEYAGKAPRCPVCRTPVLAVLAAAEPAPKAAAGVAVAEELVGEAAAAAAAPPAEPEKRPVARRRPPRPPRAAGMPRAGRISLARAGLFAGALVLIAVAAVVAVRTVRAKGRETARTAALAEIDSRLQRLRDAWTEAEKLREAAWAAANAKDDPDRYPTARAGFLEAKQRYAGLLETADAFLVSLDRWAAAFPDDVRMDLARKEARDLRKKASDALAGKQVTLGPELGQKYVLYDGEWVTPEQEKELFEKRMRDLGMVLHNGEWITRAELNRRMGLVEYQGKWYPKDVAERMKAEDEARAEAQRKREEDLSAAERARRDELLRRAEKYPPDAAVWTLDDFERPAVQWTVMPWGKPVELRVVRKGDTGVLQVKALEEVTGPDKAAISLALGADFSSRRKISFQIENTAKQNTNVALAFQTDAYYETHAKAVPQGTHTLEFDLTSGDYKCNATQWQHRSTLKARENVRQVFILFYERVDEGQVFYLDNVQVRKP